MPTWVRNALLAIFCVAVSIPFFYFGTWSFIMWPRGILGFLSALLVAFGLCNVACVILALSKIKRHLMRVVTTNSAIALLLVNGTYIFFYSFSSEIVVYATVWSTAILLNWLALRVMIGAAIEK